MKRTLPTVLLATLLLSSCATLLFPERRGQSKGNVDPNAVVMDLLLLPFWIVPGVVAFIVDYATGALYLPEGAEGGEGPIFGPDAPFSINKKKSKE